MPVKRSVPVCNAFTNWHEQNGARSCQLWSGESVYVVPIVLRGMAELVVYTNPVALFKFDGLPKLVRHGNVFVRRVLHNTSSEYAWVVRITENCLHLISVSDWISLGGLPCHLIRVKWYTSIDDASTIILLSIGVFLLLNYRFHSYYFMVCYFEYFVIFELCLTKFRCILHCIYVFV